MKNKNDNIVPWKTYLYTTFQTIIAFYLATLSLAVFFTHKGDSWIPYAILMGILYVTVIGICIARIIQRFSMAALMIIIPIAPLLALVCVVSLIPVLQWIS